MRKLFLTVLLAGLLFSLVMPGYAAQNEAILTDADIQPGETFYLTMRLPAGVRGDAAGISLSFDSALLQWLPEESSWAHSAVLKDFSNVRSEGVWASGEVIALEGDLCVLAFRVPADSKLTQTSVSCTAIVKNGSSEVGTYTADAVVRTSCDHSYGQWTSADPHSHVRSCEHCGVKQTSVHQWGEGERTPDPDNTQYTLLTYTCAACGETRSESILSNVHEIIPTLPVFTDPPETEPETLPPMTEPPEEKPDKTTGSKDNSPSRKPEAEKPSVRDQEKDRGTVTKKRQESQSDHTGHSHEAQPFGTGRPNTEAGMDSEALPQVIVVPNTAPATQPTATPTEAAADTQEASASASFPVIAVAAATAIVLGAVFLLKKKRT